MAFYRDVNQQTPTTRPDVTDVDAVVQSVRNLLLTRRGQRPFQPEYYIDLADYLFELMDVSAALDLMAHIFDKVEEFCPRVTLDKKNSYAVPNPDDNSFSVSLVFVINGFEEEGKFSVTESVRQ